MSTWKYPLSQVYRCIHFPWILNVYHIELLNTLQGFYSHISTTSKSRMHVFFWMYFLELKLHINVFHALVKFWRPILKWMKEVWALWAVRRSVPTWVYGKIDCWGPSCLSRNPSPKQIMDEQAAETRGRLEIEYCEGDFMLTFIKIH